MFLQDVLSVIKKELNKNFQFSRFLGQCVENGNILVYVCTDLQGRFAIFAIYRVDSFTSVLIFRVSCIRVLAAIIVVYFFIILIIRVFRVLNVKTYFVLSALSIILNKYSK